jgi:hypothetical protein
MIYSGKNLLQKVFIKKLSSIYFQKLKTPFFCWLIFIGNKNVSSGIIAIVQPNPKKAKVNTNIDLNEFVIFFLNLLKSSKLLKNSKIINYLSSANMSQNPVIDTTSSTAQAKIKKSPSLTSMSSSMTTFNESSQDSNLSRPSLGNNDNNKYNISNVLKHIYQIKYFQKSSQIPTPPEVANNDNAETSTNASKQFWMPV